MARFTFSIVSKVACMACGGPGGRYSCNTCGVVVCFTCEHECGDQR